MLQGRRRELQYLEKAYQKDGSQLVVLYGQQGMGKTSIIKEFCKGKIFHYYQARNCSEKEQRFQWAKELVTNNSVLGKYPAYTEIFQSLAMQKAPKKVIVVDEFSYIIKNSTAFMEELVAFMHDKWNNQPIMIILCSSAISWVENTMVSRIGKAAFEISGFLKVKSLNYLDFVKMCPGYSAKEGIAVFGILGGNPSYWHIFDANISLQENICQFILAKKGLLREEGKRIVEENLREVGVYQTLLASMASGMNKLNDLHHHTGFSRAKISVYLKNLTELELVEKAFSYETAGRDNTQKGIYRISNPFVHFWYRFVFPNASDLTMLSPEAFYEKHIKNQLDEYVAPYYVKVCREYLNIQNELSNLPIQCTKTGEWIGKAGNIDYIGQDKEGGTIIGSCNWERDILSYEDFEWLQYLVAQAKISADYYFLFSSGGFDERLSLTAKAHPHIILIGLDQF